MRLGAAKTQVATIQSCQPLEAFIERRGRSPDGQKIKRASRGRPISLCFN